MKTHLIHYSQSRRKVEIVREVPPCSYSLIETVIADKMEKCAHSIGMYFETKNDNAWYISMRVSVLNVVFITVGMKLVFQP